VEMVVVVVDQMNDVMVALYPKKRIISKNQIQKFRRRIFFL
jgi:hypothetical protein